jgi:glycine/D-amino acid oxidase-like deaminating enzyme
MLERANIGRRGLLRATGGVAAAGLAGCTPVQRPSGAAAAFGAARTLAPIRASADRIIAVTVCLRPFRAAGPRLDTETIGDTLVVHNYGHGGSGWSLSWGSGAVAVGKAMAASPRAVAVVGCGALGLTAALLAQRAGAHVTIYARDLMPQTRSARATGTWSPDSRIALAKAAAPGFAALWEQMTRASFKEYRTYLGLPGAPVEWNDRYIVSGKPRRAPPDPLGFADYSDRVADLTPPYVALPPGSTPFAGDVRRSSSMMFNIASYGHMLLNDFRLAGGRIVVREFHSPGELAGLQEKVVINCPGYGGRALWNDTSIVPVRGQMAWLIPQPEVDYGLIYDGISVLPRRDGMVAQDLRGGDMTGYGDANETPDRADAARVVAEFGQVYVA